jgi:hypothetical protein
LSLRAWLVKRTLLGMRINDVIQIVDYLAARPDVDVSRINAIGSGHMGLVLLHAARFGSSPDTYQRESCAEQLS